MITKMFRRMIIGQAMHEVIIAVRNVDVSLKIHVNIGSFGQKNTAGAWLDALKASFVLPELISLQHGGTQSKDEVLTEKVT